ncbi:Enoyl-hydratase isomerase family [Pleurostoma richardsiae]|uniref:Enoyl-hydratase isomerase family n=1 Tax=Pleurostoma richardsiae TaxID=41990 RepID=A0AA38RRM2_9PEZI|nr:Enoyl-hydratase isomerase family [Pleurostoma richardsiae]
MGSLQTVSDVPELTALERVGPRGYLRYVFPMRLTDDYVIDEVAKVLRDGYETTCRRIAIMACEAVPDPDAKQAGVLKVQKLPDGEFGDVLVKDLREPGAYPFTYAELKAKHFAVSAFDGDKLLRCGIWPLPGQRVPISLAQANFIRGGVLLTWCVLHMVGDGNTYLTWTKVWAEECRRRQGLEITKPFVIDDAMVADRERVMKPSGGNKGRVEDHPEYTVLPFTPVGPPPQMLSTTHRGQVFYFSPASLAVLKAEASPTNATKPTDQAWISSHDAFSALVWRTTVAIQSPIESLDDGDDPVSVFNIAVDGRQRTDPPVHPNTLGCWLEYVSVSAPVRQILGTHSLADLAVAVRKEMLLRLNNQFTDDVVALVDQLEDVNRLVPTAFFDLLGKNCVLTSWATFELYDVEWGPMLGGRIEAVRCPNNGILPGCQVILPTLPDGGIELLVGTEGEFLHRLSNDPLWMKFAEAR